MKISVANCAFIFLLLAGNAVAGTESSGGQQLFKAASNGFLEIVVNHEGPTDKDGCHRGDDGVIHCH